MSDKDLFDGLEEDISREWEEQNLILNEERAKYGLPFETFDDPYSHNVALEVQERDELYDDEDEDLDSELDIDDIDDLDDPDDADDDFGGDDGGGDDW